MTDSVDRSAELALQQRALLAVRSLKLNAQSAEIPTIPRRADPGGAAPLSFTQQRIWFLQRLEPTSPAYNMVGSARLRGPLDREALRQALQAIMRRHESLRTTFTDGVDGPVQTVQPGSEFSLPVRDLSSIPPDERDDAAHRLATALSKVPFDLTRDPLLRGHLLRLGEQEHVLLLGMHHTASDAWSLGVLYRDLSGFYQEFATGAPARLPDLPIQYADFSVWQHQRMQSEALQKQLAYWKRNLEGAPPILELPTDRPRPTAASYVGAYANVEILSSLTGALRSLTREEGGTLFMTLLAAFQLLLARWSGQNDIVVGAPIAGRTHVELERMIGVFLNTLVLRTNLSGNPTFRELFARVRETALAAYSNQEVPFERLVEELQPERSLGYNPLFQVLFQVDNTTKGSLQLPGVQISEFGTSGFSAKFDITLRVAEVGDRLSCTCKYSQDLFSQETILLLLEQYQVLLEQIVASPDSRIGTYTLVTPRTRHLIPDPQAPLSKPRYPTVTEAVTRVVREAPERVAIRQGARTHTYGELGAAVEALALELRARGVTPGSVVAMTGRSSFGLVASMLATLASGAVMLPVAVNLPERRKQLMLREARASHLLQVGDDGPEGEWTRSLDAVMVLPVDERTGHVIGSGVEASPAAPAGPAAPAPEDAAYIFFTSGTTGTPKAVLGTHQGIGHFLDWQRTTFGIAPDDRCAQFTNISFDVILRDIFLPLTSGATLCIPQEELTPDRALDWLAAEGITVLHVVPSLALAWLEQVSLRYSLPTLRWIFSAGEPLPDTLVKRWRQVVSGECGVVNLYGPTETTMVKCWYRVPSEVLPGVQPVGAPLPQSQALVLSAENRLCGVNELGEVVLRTPFMTHGYLNAADEQRSQFFPNPFGGDPGDLVYRSGDLGRIRPDGSLLVLGRLDHQMKIRGVRIEPGEVTAVLAQHPQVQACAVIGRQLGNQPMALIAYVVAGQSGITAAALRGYLAERLPTAMVPSAFVLLDRLPLTPNGKLDLRALPLPEEAGPAEEAYVPPGSPLEEGVAQIWSEVLRRERVGLNDDFFALGGHSLLATRVVARIRTTFGIELPLRTIFESPTVATLAMAITRVLLATLEDAPSATADGRHE